MNILKHALWALSLFSILVCLIIVFNYAELMKIYSYEAEAGYLEKVSVSSKYLNVIYRYQALIAGILAFMGGLLAGYAGWRIEIRNRTSKITEARILLNFVLPKINNFLESAFVEIWNNYPHERVESPHGMNPDYMEIKLPDQFDSINAEINYKELDDQIFEWLAKIAAHIPDSSNASESIIDLVKGLQIFTSRIQRTGDSISYYETGLLLYCLHVLSLNNDLYGYARFEEDSIHREVYGNAILNSYGSMEYFEDNYFFTKAVIKAMLKRHKLEFQPSL